MVVVVIHAEGDRHDQHAERVACSASGSDRAYLDSAVIFFNGTARTKGAAQAAECKKNLFSSLISLSEMGWPCDGTNTTIEYVRTCVGLVSAQAAN